MQHHIMTVCSFRLWLVSANWTQMFSLIISKHWCWCAYSWVCYNMCVNRPCLPINTTHLWHTTFSCQCRQRHLLCFTVASSAPPLLGAPFAFFFWQCAVLVSVTRSGDALKPEARLCTTESCGKILSAALIYMSCILLCTSEPKKEGQSECDERLSLLRHTTTKYMFWSQPWGGSASMNRQLFHAFCCSYTWYSPTVYLCVSLSPVHLWSHGLKLSYLRKRRENKTALQNEMDGLHQIWEKKP